MPELGDDALPESAEQHLAGISSALRMAFGTNGSDQAEALAVAYEYFVAAKVLAVRTAQRRAPAAGEVQAVDFTDIVASRLQEHRVMAGITQAYLAAVMKRLGFKWSRMTVTEVEGGSRKVALDELLALAALYAVPMVEFLLPYEGESLRYPALGDVEGSVVQVMVVGPSDGPNWAPALTLTLDQPDAPNWRPAYPYWEKRESLPEETNNQATVAVEEGSVL